MNAAYEKTGSKTLSHYTEQKTFTKGCWFHGSASHETEQCDAFRRLDGDGKSEESRNLFYVLKALPH